MLLELKIKNLAVVEDVTIAFSEGMNVLTGSTGAGKSIILTAVDLLSGARGRRSLLRRGADELVLEGTFRVPVGWHIRERIGMDGDEDIVAVRREIKADGKSRIWINGTSATNSLAREITSSLLELHGQRRQQELLDPATHLGHLDSGGDYKGLLLKVEEEIAEFRSCWKTLHEMLLEEERNREQEDYLRFQLSELDGLDLEDDIDGKLERNIRRIENIARYRGALEKSLTILGDEEGSVIDRLAIVERELEYLAGLDERWLESSERLSEVRISVQDTVRELERAAGGNEEYEDLEGLQDRLASIQRAMRKYRMDCAGLINRRDEIRSILEALKDGSGSIAEARERVEKAKDRIVPLLDDLSAKRKAFAASLDREMTAELRGLGMEGALFRTDVERVEIRAFNEESDELDLTACGWDNVEFMIRTNTGEDTHPLADVASGGELSRVTLVLKKLLAREKAVATLIFDEIDSGLGADLGKVVAEKMKELSSDYQIICITHLPQVAAVALQHILIEKEVAGGRTSTKARVLNEGERTGEIARMLGGDGKLRELLADEMLNEGKSARSSAG